MQAQLAEVVAKLDELGAANHSVRLPRTIGGVGPRLAGAVVTMFDDPHRFRTAGQVSSYIGMVPKQFDSGETQRARRITRHGNQWCGLCWWKWLGARCVITPGPEKLTTGSAAAKNHGRRSRWSRWAGSCWCVAGPCCGKQPFDVCTSRGVAVRCPASSLRRLVRRANPVR